MVGVLVPIAVLVALVVAAAYMFSRGKEAISFDPRTLLRLYVYIASLAAVVIFTIGLGSVVNVALSGAFGTDFIYGGPGPGPVALTFRCSPESVAKGCVEPTPEQLEQQRIAQKQQVDRRRDEDLIRGITNTVAGVLFWGVHFYARRLLADPPSSPQWRMYLMTGTVAFGLATLVLLPTGLYQALSNRLIPATPNTFRQSADSLGGGIVALPVWLAYLRLLVGDFRVTAAVSPTTSA